MLLQLKFFASRVQVSVTHLVLSYTVQVRIILIYNVSNIVPDCIAKMQQWVEEIGEERHGSSNVKGLRHL